MRFSSNFSAIEFSLSFVCWIVAAYQFYVAQTKSTTNDSDDKKVTAPILLAKMYWISGIKYTSLLSFFNIACTNYKFTIHLICFCWNYIHRSLLLSLLYDYSYSKITFEWHWVLYLQWNCNHCRSTCLANIGPYFLLGYYQKPICRNKIWCWWKIGVYFENINNYFLNRVSYSLIPRMMSNCNKTNYNSIFSLIWKIIAVVATLNRLICMIICFKWYLNGVQQV